MTFPNSILTVAPKSTVGDNVVSPHLYINGVDLNIIFAELFGIQSQLGATNKADITAVGSQIFFAGPAQVVIGGQIFSFAGGNVTFGGPGVFFAWIDETGTLDSGAALPVVDSYLPLAQVTAGTGGAVTSWIDLRPWLVGTGGGSGGFPSSYRSSTSQRRLSRRDISVLATTDFLPASFSPLSDAAWFYIDIVSDTTIELTMLVTETTTNSMIIGTVTAGVEARFLVQAPKRYDSGSADIVYQLQTDLDATIDFITIMEVEYDALLTTVAAAVGITLIPFSVPFSYSDTSPLLLFSMEAGDVVTEVELVIETAFDDPTATLQVGIATSLSEIFGTSDIDVDAPGQYSNNSNYTTAIVDALVLTIAPMGSSIGSGYVSGIIRRA